MTLDKNQNDSCPCHVLSAVRPKSRGLGHAEIAWVPEIHTSGMIAWYFGKVNGYLRLPRAGTISKISSYLFHHENREKNPMRSWLTWSFFILFPFVSSLAAEPNAMYRFQHYVPLLTQPWYFNESRDMAVDGDGNVYLVDSHNLNVKKFTAQGHFITQLSVLTERSTTIPRRIAVRHNRVYVTYLRAKEDTGDGDAIKLVRVFQRNGALLGEWDLPRDSAAGEYGIVVDSEQRIYLAGMYGDQRVISVFVTNEQVAETQVTTWEVPFTPGEARANSRLALTIDSQDRLYALDTAGARVYQFDGTGQLLDTWGEKGAQSGQLLDPADIAIDGEDHLYIADKSNSRVQKFTTSGQWLTSFARERAPGLAENWWAESVAQAPIGRITRLLADPVAREALGEVIPQDPAADPGVDSFADLLDRTLGKAATNDMALNRALDPTFLPQTLAVDPNTRDVYVGYNFPNNAVRKYDAQGRFITEWSSARDARGFFRVPLDVARDAAGRTWVTDLLNHRVVRHDSAASAPRMFGQLGNGPGEFLLPSGIATDSQRNVLVVDTGNARVQKFSADGEWIGGWGGFHRGWDNFLGLVEKYDTLEGLLDAVLDWDIKALFVVLEVKSALDQLNVDWSLFWDWELEQFFASALADRSYQGFIFPLAIAVDGQDRVYVTEPVKGMVMQFSPEGDFLRAIGQRGEEPGQLKLPMGVAVDSQGLVYVSDLYRHALLVFDAEGHFMREFGGHKGNQPGQFNNPAGLAVDAAGQVYLADSRNHRVQKYNPATNEFQLIAGAFGTAAGQFTYPGGVSIDPDGVALAVTDTNNNRIQHFALTAFSPGKAIVVAGYLGDEEDDLRNNLQTAANFGYRALMMKGYRKEEIFFMNSQLGLDADDNGLADDVNAEPSNEMLRHALTDWAKDAEYRFLYLVDHGSNDIFMMNADEKLYAMSAEEKPKAVEEGETISDENDLTVWLNQSQAPTVVLYDACYSGSFTDASLQPNFGQQRVVFSSASATEKASMPGEGSLSFSGYFWRYSLQGLAPGEAFTQAAQAIQKMTHAEDAAAEVKQTPQVSDYAGGEALLLRHIGNPNPPRHAEMPVIQTLTVPDHGESGWLQIQATVAESPQVSEVIAQIRRATEVSASTEVIRGYMELPLSRVEGNRFAASYPHTLGAGTIQISVYAFDTQGRVSQPKTAETRVMSSRIRKAILVGGQDSGGLSWAYRALQKQGLNDQAIRYLRGDGMGVANVDGAATAQTLLDALEPALHEDSAEVIVYLEVKRVTETDLVLGDGSRIWLETLDEKLDALGIPALVFVTGDYAGKIISSKLLAPDEDQIRFLLTNTGPRGNAQDCHPIQEFAEIFWTHVFYGSISTYQLFADAEYEQEYLTDLFCGDGERLKAFFPMMASEASGTGQLKENTGEGDKKKPADIHNLTTGVMIAPNHPYLGQVPEHLSLGQRDHDFLILRVTVHNASGYSLRVWADVTALDTARKETIRLEFPRENDEYRIHYAGFLEPGAYLVRYQAQYHPLAGGESFTTPPAFSRVLRLADEQQLIASQQRYRTGDQVQLELPEIPPGLRRYLALTLPSGEAYALRAVNQFEPLNLDAPRVWPEDAELALDITVMSGFPTGRYTVYQVTLPEDTPFSPSTISTRSLDHASFVIQ